MAGDTTQKSKPLSHAFHFFFLNILANFVDLFLLAVLGFCCSCSGFSLVAASGGYSLVVVRGLLTAGAS